MRLRALQSRGDTIIEVMIVLTVLGLAISIAYATASRSLIDARQAQESSEGTSIAQSQIEQLRSLASKKVDIFKSDVTFFCVNSAGTFNAAPFAASTDYRDLEIYPEECKTEIYHTAVNYEPDSSTFTVRVVWDNVSGDGQDTVTMVYKIHPSTPIPLAPGGSG